MGRSSAEIWAELSGTLVTMSSEAAGLVVELAQAKLRGGSWRVSGYVCRRGRPWDGRIGSVAHPDAVEVGGEYTCPWCGQVFREGEGFEVVVRRTERMENG